MLRDDAIREGLLAPTKTDVERMNLSKDELAELGKKRAANKKAAEAAEKAAEDKDKK